MMTTITIITLAGACGWIAGAVTFMYIRIGKIETAILGMLDTLIRLKKIADDTKYDIYAFRKQIHYYTKHESTSPEGVEFDRFIINK